MIEDTWTPPEFSDYQSARELFEACRLAALDADRIARVLARMESCEDVQAQSYEAAGHSGHRCDPHAATDARMAYETRISKRQQWDYQLIDLVSALAYGKSFMGCGGLVSHLGPSYADVIWWRCCAAASWDEVAHWCGKSRNWCVQAYLRVQSFVDSHGAQRVLDGID